MTTDQDIFKIVRNHLLQQNEKSMNYDDMCGYRGREGKKCAVGVLIHDNHYRAFFEGQPYDREYVLEAIMKSNPEWDMSPTSFSMLGDLQHLHDSYYPHEWERNLGMMAFEENGDFSKERSNRIRP